MLLKKIGICISLLLASINVLAQQKVDSTRIALENSFTNLDEAVKQPDKVFKLSLNKRKYAEFPWEIFQFKNLKELHLSGNKITKIPKEIGQLKDLEKLDLSKNNIVKIPNEIGDLTNLKTLMLFKNEIDTIPASIGKLKKLETLDLWSNEISFIPDEIKELASSLKVLELRDILFNEEQQQRIYGLLPNTKINFSPSCTCKQ